MPLTVAEQFAIMGWWALVVVLMGFAWVCYLKLRAFFTKTWQQRVMDLLLVMVLFSYILAVKVFL